MSATRRHSKNQRLFGGVYAGKRVLVTGHTGFKGAWLSEWLLALGANVTGYSLEPPTRPALFDQLGLADRLQHIPGDLLDAPKLNDTVAATQPDFVFHLAAQSIVRESYARPRETWATNVMGTLHLLEALRAARQPCAAVFVTSDKCYENRDWFYGYREEDPLGGYDPYSASKAAAELVISSMRRSFFAEHPVRIASVRAGNVLGGGDWAKFRIVPDCVRALLDGQTIAVRNPSATRPWQHVLEPLSGYLWLGAALSSPELVRQPVSALSSAFNFGPGQEGNRTVREVVETVLRHWPGQWADQSQKLAPHEARWLQLATDKAQTLLGWGPVWRFSETVEQTIIWYRRMSQVSNSKAIQTFTRRQMQTYADRARALHLPWAAA